MKGSSQRKKLLPTEESGIYPTFVSILIFDDEYWLLKFKSMIYLLGLTSSKTFWLDEHQYYDKIIKLQFAS